MQPQMLGILAKYDLPGPRWTLTKLEAGMDGSSRGGIYAPGLDSDSRELLNGRGRVQNVVLVSNNPAFLPVLDNLSGKRLRRIMV